MGQQAVQGEEGANFALGQGGKVVAVELVQAVRLLDVFTDVTLAFEQLLHLENFQYVFKMCSISHSLYDDGYIDDDFYFSTHGGMIPDPYDLY